MTATVVPDRRPDRVERGPWEPHKTGTRTFHRVVSGSLMTGHDHEVVEEDVIVWRRRRCEFWDIPERRWADGEVVGGVLVLTARYEPARTVGRWEWEYER